MARQHVIVARLNEPPNKTEDLTLQMGMVVTTVPDAWKKSVLFWHEAFEGKEGKVTYGYKN